MDGRVIKVLREGTHDGESVKTEAVLYGREIEIRDVVSKGGTTTTRPGRATARQLEDVLSLVRGLEGTPQDEGAAAGKVLHPTSAKGKPKGKRQRKK